MSENNLSAVELRMQHIMIQIIIIRGTIVTLFHNSLINSHLQEEQEYLAPITYKTESEIAIDMNLSFEETTILLHNLVSRGFIWVMPDHNNSCKITGPGLLTFKQSLLLREANKIEDDEKKEKLANRISVANIVIPILAFLLPLIWAYFFQIEPLQKEVDNLKDTVIQLRTGKEHLKIQSKD